MKSLRIELAHATLNRKTLQRLCRRFRAAPYAIAVLLLALPFVGCQSAETPEAAAATLQESEEEHEEPELAVYMSDMQRWAHKAALSINAQNAPLADFYLHELEETVEAVQEEVPEYEGHAIGPLTEQMLVPSLEALDEAVDAEDWRAAAQRLGAVAQSCNQCHAATAHGFVEIQLDDLANPYAQSFKPQGEASGAPQ